MRVFTCYTGEIDDIQTAIEEIAGQLERAGALERNTVGLITCHYEFVHSGVMQAICDSLPFETAGIITPVQAVPGQSGTLLLTLLVMTSDQVSFQTVLTPSLRENPTAVIEGSFRNAMEEQGEKPNLILSFASFMVENSGDNYVETITRVSGGVPCFGTLSVDDTQDFRNCFSIHNGRHYRSRMAMVLLRGPVTARFYIATISDDKIIDRAALVTSSEGHVLKEVNGRPVAEYFEDLGLTKASETSYAMASLPFMLDYGDGTPPVSKVFISLNEERHAICAGAMPEGSTLYLGVFDKEDVLTTTGAAVREALSAGEPPSVLLAYSCISRSMSMGGDIYAEIEQVRRQVGDLPFLMAYSGGEMCPTIVKESHAINRFHNNAFILCALSLA